MALTRALAATLDGTEGVGPCGAFATCAKLLANLLSDPRKYRTINAGAKGLHARLTQFEHGEGCVLACGFRRVGEVFEHDGTEEDVAALSEEAHAALSRFESIRSAIVLVGDSNAPAVAQ